MKKYYCDTCGKEFGGSIRIGAAYSISEFNAELLREQKTEADMCASCYKKIAEAQKKAIEEIKSNYLNIYYTD